MKVLFYRFASRRSFAKLFSILACVALGSLLAQQAIAQDFFGWEPAPPSSWGGDWDASLDCGSLAGITTLTRTPSGVDSVLQQGDVSCTFTDPANNFQATATCSLDIQIDNLNEFCDLATSTLTVSGDCPFKKGNDPVVGATVTTGTIDCTGAPFCSYAGNNPTGNTSGGCVWHVGFGVWKGSNIVDLSQNQCETAFPATTDLGVSQVFKFTQTYAGPGCTGSFAGLGNKVERFCHSDTWDGSQPAACDFPGGAVKFTAEGTLASHLTADTEYNTTINPTCHPQNSGIVTLTVYATDHDPDTITNAVALEEINQATITVNEFPVIPGSCTPPSPNMASMTCKVNKCIDGVNIIAGTIAPDGQTATLTMQACIGDVIDGKCDGTPVVGDTESRNVSTSTSAP